MRPTKYKDSGGEQKITARELFVFMVLIEIGDMHQRLLSSWFGQTEGCSTSSIGEIFPTVFPCIQVYPTRKDSHAPDFFVFFFFAFRGVKRVARRSWLDARRTEWYKTCETPTTHFRGNRDPELSWVDFGSPPRKTVSHLGSSSSPKIVLLCELQAHRPPLPRLSL